MLFIIFPLAVKNFWYLTFSSPNEEAITVFLVILILALIHSAVSKNICALSMHQIIFPLTKINSAIIPKEGSLTIKWIVRPISNISGIICPFIFTKALFESLVVVTLKHHSIFPFFFAKTMELIKLPKSRIFWAIKMSILTITLCHIINEIAIIEISACVIKFSPTILETTSPSTFIYCSIGPPHYTKTLFPLCFFFNLTGISIFISYHYDLRH